MEITGGISDKKSGRGITLYHTEVGFGFAFPKWTNCVPATAESKSSEIKALNIKVFVFTGYPCFKRGFSVVKSVFIKIS